MNAILTNPAGLQPQTDLIFQNIAANFAASVRGVIQSNQPRDGYFWFIPYLQINNTDTAVGVMSLYLCNAENFALAAGQVANPSPTPAPPGCILLAPTTPLTGNFTGAFQSQQGVPCTPFWRSSSIIVPSRFSLLALEQSTLSTNPRVISMAFVYKQLPNSCMPLIFA
jgi:hypothetical protein